MTAKEDYDDAMEDLATLLDKHSSRHKVFRVLDALPWFFPPYVEGANNPVVPEGYKVALIVDTETTGLEKTAKIIEIACLQVIYLPDFSHVQPISIYSDLQDPGEPLSEDVKRVTGLTDEMLKGKKIDGAMVEAMLASANIIIAHNAGFDCPLIERDYPAARGKRWACSANEIPWKEWGCPSASMQVIAWWMSRFYRAHRAVGDVHALLSILCTGEVPGRTSNLQNSLFAQLVASARKRSFKVYANGSPFDKKDILKERGYRWDADGKVWSKEFRNNDAPEGQPGPVDAEVLWLREHASPRPTVQEFTAKERYR